MTNETNETKKINHRIRALLNKTVENGATEAEAREALTKAYELMSKHNLSEADLSEPKTYISKLVKYKTTYGNGRWVGNLLRVVAEHNQVWRLLGHGVGKYILFGTPENIELTEQFMEYAYACAITYGKPKFKLQELDRYQFWTSYGDGFSDGVETLFKKVSEDVGTTAIVLAGLQITKQNYPHPTRTVHSRRIRLHADAFQNGVADGKKIRKAVETNATQYGPKQIGLKA